MKPEKQVCSLELAKKLKELGVKQNSLFYWVENFGRLKSPQLVNKDDLFSLKMLLEGTAGEGQCYSAFTVAELGAMLPAQTICRKDYINTTKHWMYHIEIADIKTDIIFAENEADVRAKMLCYLIENNLLKIII